MIKFAYALGGLVVGVAVTTALGWSVQEKEMSIPQAVDHGSMTMTMEDMSARLVGKSGDEFDRIFIEDMIVHHQGAIDMANLALEHAGHEEIKTMAQEIISAQTREIEQMKTWRTSWFQ